MAAGRFWQTWLTVAAWGMAAFGVLLALFPLSPLFSPLQARLDPVFWPAGVTDPGIQPFQRWIYGAWGATVAGFGLLAAAISRQAFARHERWARNGLAAAVSVWYALDTAISIGSEVWVNAAFNTVVLVLFLLPLAATWRQFAGLRERAPGAF
jgi:hypothetical protein